MNSPSTIYLLSFFAYQRSNKQKQRNCSQSTFKLLISLSLRSWRERRKAPRLRSFFAPSTQRAVQYGRTDMVYQSSLTMYTGSAKKVKTVAGSYTVRKWNLMKGTSDVSSWSEGKNSLTMRCSFQTVNGRLTVTLFSCAENTALRDLVSSLHFTYNPA